MKQFGKILKFELKNYAKNKAFVGVTIFLMVVIAIVMFFLKLQHCLNQTTLRILRQTFPLCP